MKDLLEEMVCNSSLLPAEHKAAASILRTIMKEDSDPNKVDLTALLAPPTVSRRRNVNNKEKSTFSRFSLKVK